MGPVETWSPQLRSCMCLDLICSYFGVFITASLKIIPILVFSFLKNISINIIYFQLIKYISFGISGFTYSHSDMS